MPRGVKPLDVGKSALVAIALLLVNVAISIAVIAVYSYAVAPGHEAAFYDAAAQRIAPWSSVVFGGPLFFAAAYLLSRKPRDRNPMAFALSMFGVYALIDLGVMVAAGALAAHAAIVALSLTTKLVGAIAGAHVGRSGARSRV
jgi:hypothetical protein